eukprot:TRINITY_DN5336_c0_g1_i5.p1 TRINITY_DN5336_c0_g1~~TRINITY_DN5336_c0_g1_i5.p1  ORF type:complete len:174 (+),score=26.72 TRINITY_DN5336_c0_g1_i5:155-676(+)
MGWSAASWWLSSCWAPFPTASSLSCNFKRHSCCTATTPPTDFPKRSFHHPDLTRPWIQPITPSLSPSLSPSRILVVSYNILGDQNASYHRDLYAHIPSHLMKWDRRKRLICQDLRGWDADIVCLQRRTGEAVDGCAMLWKEKLVRLLEGESIEFREFGLRDNVAQLFVFEADV